MAVAMVISPDVITSSSWSSLWSRCVVQDVRLTARL